MWVVACLPLTMIFDKGTVLHVMGLMGKGFAVRFGRSIVVGSAAVLLLGLSPVHGAQAENVAAETVGDYQLCGYGEEVGARAGAIAEPALSPRSSSNKPGKVRNLDAPNDAITDSRAKLVWKAPKKSGASEIKKYQFRLKVEGSKWGKWESKSAQKLAVSKKEFAKSYKQLTPNETYVFEVRAENSNGKGEKSQVTFRTYPDCDPIAPRAGTLLRHVGPYTYENNNNDGSLTDWKNETGTFTTLKTYGYVDGIPSTLTVDTPAGDTCISIFDQFDDKPFATAGSGEAISVEKPDGSKPQHLTIIPWQSTGGGCNINTDFVNYDASTVIAVFVSQSYWSSPPANATVCKISASDAQEIDDMLRMGGKTQWREGDCIIDQPRQRIDGAGNQVFTGSLYTMASDGKSNPLYIELEDDVRLKMPLNAMMSELPQGSEPCVIETARPIIVTGFGRIDTPINYYAGTKDKQPGDFKVKTGQLILNSSAGVEFPIDVSGITIANSPIRHDAAVKLNFVDSCKGGTRPYIGYRSGNAPVKIFDVKRVVWNGASDAFEVGQGAYVGHSWILSADDSIKISAPNQRFENMTVLQGNAGGVVNIGSYGYNLGTAGSSVEGVYVPRIVQGGPTGDWISDPRNGEGGGTGVIQTLTCPQKNKRNEDQKVTDVTINNFTIAALGGDDIQNGVGVNSYNRPFSLGIQDMSFCSGDWSDVTFGNFQFTNMDFYGNPRRKSLMYVSLAYATNVNVNMLPIRFCAGPDNSANCDPFPPPLPSSSTDRPVTYWPSGDPSGGGYYVCGTYEDGECWTLDETQQYPQTGVNNVEFTPGFPGQVGYPYGP